MPDKWGHKGYRARTKDRGHSIFIGWYDTREEAHAAVKRYRVRNGLPTTKEAVANRQHQSMQLWQQRRRQEGEVHG